MDRSASRHDGADSPIAEFLKEGLGAAGAALARNPVLVGGTTAFLVTLCYVSANALWYQPQAHPGALFQTRTAPAAAHDGGVTKPVGEVRVVAARKPDPRVEQVQSILMELDIYTGSVDGIDGPQTRKAVEDYQRQAGLDVSGEIDKNLLDRMTTRATGLSAPPVKPAVQPAVVAPGPATKNDVVKVQAGLKAFGHDSVDVDGAMGQKTRGAIREFQSLFGLPVSGEIDAPLLAKMREIGLTN